MTENKFFEHCRIQHKNVWEVMGTYEAREFHHVWMRAMASDLRKVAANIDELCTVYEMENKVNE